MNAIFIFPNDDGSVAFGYPAAECGLSIEDIAKKDVPPGKPFKIVPDALVPKDHTFFNAFEADFSNPDGYGMGYEAWAASKEQA